MSLAEYHLALNLVALVGTVGETKAECRSEYASRD
jgi:hypothetical protein